MQQVQEAFNALHLRPAARVDEVSAFLHDYRTSRNEMIVVGLILPESTINQAQELANLRTTYRRYGTATILGTLG